MMSSPDESLPTRSRDHSILQEEKNIPPLAITSGDEEEYQFMSGARLYFVVLGLCLTVLLMGLDNAILATAIPTITTKFNSLDDVGWYGSAYLICTCALQPISGKIYRYFNLKYTYLVYLCIFEFGSLICAISVSSTMLIIGRAIAGCGAAGLFSGAIVIVANSIPLRQRPIYTGAIASMFSVSNIVGPILGGAFTQHVSWRWCFYINLPLGAISIVILVFFFHPHSLPDSNHPITEKMKHLDLPGLILFIPAVVMLLLAVQWGGNTYPWKSAMVIGLIVGAGAVLILFALWQWHQQDEGSIPPRILGHRTVWTAVGVCAFGMGSAQLVAYYLPMWFQVIKGASPLGSGIRFIPTVLGSVVTSIVAGGLVTKFGLYNPWLIAGGITTAISAGIFSTFKTNESSSMINGIQVLGGFASSLAIQMPVIAIMSVLPQSDISVGTSMSTFSAFFGGAIFLAIAENIFVSRLVSEIVSKAPSVNAQAVVLAGAQGMRKVVGEADLPAVIQAYNSAITATFYVGTAGGILAFFFSLGVEWKSVKGKQIM